jgi:hypothetical protein
MIPALLSLKVPSMSQHALARVYEVEKINAARPQVPLLTHHLIHAGMYSRTIKLDAGTVITGALIKRSTTLIISGDVCMNSGADAVRITGYHVLPAQAHRKQIFLAMAQTHMTMTFQTKARTVEDAEAEFTDDVDMLCSRRDDNVVVITEDEL